MFMEIKNLDFYNSYNGRFLTSCQIKIIKDPQKNTVVEIIQQPIAKCTTITNTIDSLAKHEIKEFSVKNEICNKIKNASFSSVSNLIINLFDFNMKVFLCNLLKQFFSFFVSSLHNKKNIVWVEYYPAGVYFFEEDRYAIVSFDKNYNNPQWEHLSLEDLSKRTGYDKSNFALSA